MAQLTWIDPQRGTGKDLLNAIGTFERFSQFLARTSWSYQRMLECLVDEFGGGADVA